jgi:hypothetical protein
MKRTLWSAGADGPGGSKSKLSCRAGAGDASRVREDDASAGTSALFRRKSRGGEIGDRRRSALTSRWYASSRARCASSRGGVAAMMFTSGAGPGSLADSATCPDGGAARGGGADADGGSRFAEDRRGVEGAAMVSGPVVECPEVDVPSVSSGGLGRRTC